MLARGEAALNETSGHGHVFRDGPKARCGGPGHCAACSADLDQFVASDDPGLIAGRFRADLVAELQACFDRARAAT
jgi:hypothetical protein